MKMNIRTKIMYFALFFTSVLFVSACTKATKYDSATYDQLVGLKSEMKEFFVNCQNNGASGDGSFSKLNKFKSDTAKYYNYEKYKENNNESIEQLQIVDNTVASVIKRYKSNKLNDVVCSERSDNKLVAETGCLTSGYCNGKWSVLSSKLDIAISTENLKNKDK